MARVKERGGRVGWLGEGVIILSSMTEGGEASTAKYLMTQRLQLTPCLLIGTHRK